jgi:excisionase family DNA binding protein
VEKEYMTVNQAARVLGLAPVTVRLRLRKGIMRGERLGRDWLIPREEVERWRDVGRLPSGPKPRGEREVG